MNRTISAAQDSVWEIIGDTLKTWVFVPCRTRIMQIIMSIMVAACLFFSTVDAFAFGVNECAATRFGADLGCTAADVSITGIAIAAGGPSSCVGGDNITADLDITVNFATPDRWDIGIFISNDGKDPQLVTPAGAASCSVGILPRPPAVTPFLNLDNDGCGDGNGSIGGGTGAGVLNMADVPVPCQAFPGSGGNLYIPFVVSWDNQKTPPGDVCTTNADPVPNTKSKCNAPDSTVAAEVLLSTVSIVVLPSISKTDGTSTISPGDSTSYDVVITNTTGDTLSNAVFTDPAVADLSVSNVSCVAAGGATCPATSVAAMQGAGITIPAMPVDSSVTFTIDATLAGTATGTITNTASVSVSTETNTVSDINTIVQKPTISTSFAVSDMASGGNTDLTVTIGNTNAGAITLSSLFTDTLPTGMTINTGGNTGTCTGVTATGGAGSFSIANGTSIPSGGCTIIVEVTSSTAGAASNTIAAGDLQTSAGTNASPASDILNVYIPPTVTKTFTPSTIASGGTSSMVITVTNPAGNPGNLTGVSVSDTYAGTLVNNAAGGVLCSGTGSATLTGGVDTGTTVGFSAGTIEPAGTCTITQSVSATGTSNNTTGTPSSTGPVALTGTAAGPITLTVTSLIAPTVSTSFAVSDMASGGNTDLTVTIGNTNAGAITLTSLFTDTLPAGMTINTGGNTGTCTGVTATGGAGSFSIANGTSIPSGGCTIIVEVTSSTAGAATNTIAAGDLQTSAGTNASPASDILNVYIPPTVTKSFTPSTIASGGTSSMVITVTNPAGNPGNLTGVSISDTYAGTLVNNAAGGVLCSGTGSATLTGGVDTGTTVGFSAGTIEPAGTCTITQSVSATGTSNNTTGTPSSTGPVALTGTAAGPITLTVTTLDAPTVSTSFAVSDMASGGNTDLTVTISNTNAGAITLSSLFTDTLPTGMTINTGGNTGTCTGVTATGGAGSFSIANGTSIPSGGCTIIVNVTSSTAGAASNTIAAGDLQTSAGTNASPASDILNVYIPPTVTKSFTPSTIASGGTSSMVITVTNPAGNPGNLTGVSVSDTYAGTLVNNAAGGVLCSGTGSATLTGGVDTGTTVGFSAGTIEPAGTCTITQSVSATGTSNNTTGTPSSTGPVALTGTAAGPITLTVTTLDAPTVSTSFAVSDMASGANTDLTVTIGNTNAGAITLSSLFTDTLPTGMTINTGGNTGTCTGVTATGGAGSFTIANGTSIPSGGCTIIVEVTSSTAGAATNTIAAGDLQTSAGTNASPASDILNVYIPPTVTKSFTPSTIASGGTSSMVITVTNPAGNPGNLTGVSISDTYAGTLVNNAAGDVLCSGTGSATLTGGVDAGTTVGFNTGTIEAGGTCTITQSVSATGTSNNTTGTPSSTGPVALTGTAAGPITLTVTSLVAPTVSTSFAVSDMASGGNTDLTVTIGNTNAGAITLSSLFTDTLPTGMTINTGGNTGTCTGVTATGGAGSFTIANGTSIPSGGCTIIVEVTSSTAGAATNTIAAGDLQTSAGTNASPASDILNVYIPPTVTKSFTPSTIASGGTSSMVITVTNPAGNPGNLTGVSVSDTYAGTLVNNAAGGVLCSGTGSATLTGGVDTGTTVGFSAGTIEPAGTCTITQSVSATGTSNNTTGTPSSTGPVALTGTAAGPITLTVTSLVAPTISTSFAVSDMASSGNTDLTVTIGNTNAGAITLSSLFTDTLPTGMTINTGGNTGTCTGVTATGGAGSFTIANGTSIPSGGCTIIVEVTSSTAGAATNTIAAGDLQTSAGTNASPASDILNVYIPPTVTKSFTPSTIASGGTSSMVITVTNPAGNPGNLTGVSVSDTYAGTLVNNAAGGVLCSGTGSATLTGGVDTGTTVGFSAGTIEPAGTCTITQSVSATGTSNNTTGAPSSTGPVALTGTAAGPITLTVTTLDAPTVSTSFAVSDMASGGNTDLTVTISNTNAGAITLSSLFTDTLPTGMTINTGGNTGTCTGVTATGGAGSFTIANGTSIPSGGCTIIVEVTSSTAGAASNTIAAGDLQTSAGTNASPASDILNVYIPPTVTKTFTPSTIASGGTSSMVITVTNPAGNPGNLTGVSVSDTYAGTLVNNAAGGVLCSGTGSATLTGGVDTGTTVGFSAGTIEPAGTCTITQSVSATGTSNNTTGAPSTTGPVALTGTAAGPITLTVTSLVAPTVSTSFAVSDMASGGNTDLTVTIGNTNGGAITLSSLFTDTLPTGMTINTGGNTGTCTGVTATGGAGSFTIANGTSIPSGGCTIIVNVTSSTAGAATNTIAAGDLQTSAGTNASPASDILNVYIPPTVTKSFTPSTIASGGTSSMVITVTNPAGNPGNLTGVSISDTYAGTLVNNAAGGVLCSGTGSATLTGGVDTGTTVGFSAGTIEPAGTCTITQSVSATGTSNNTTGTPSSTGPVALTGTAAGPITLTVSTLDAPTVSTSFAVSDMASGGNTDLTVTIGNTNGGAITLSSLFTDTLPTGMTINTGGNTGTCTGVTATGGAGSFSIANGTSIPSGGCTIIVEVTSSTAGAATNTIAAGDLQTSAGTNASPASDILNVYIPPTVTKSFTPSTIASGGTSSMVITVTNPAGNPGNLTGVSISDTYAGTLVNNAAGGVLCSGTGSATLTGGVDTGTTVGFSAGTIEPAGTCTITQSVSATGTSNNTTGTPSSTGPVALTGTAAGPITLTITTPTLTIDDVTVTEGVGLLFTVSLNVAVSGPFDVNVSFVDVTATGGAVALVAPEDYGNDAVTLNFAGTAGETRQFTVPTLDDAIQEAATETFNVLLTSSDPLINDVDTGTGTITDNESGNIGGNIFHDTDFSSTVSSGEEFIGIPVELIAPGPDGLFNTPDDIVLQSTTTDPTGAYSFLNVLDPKVMVAVDPPSASFAGTNRQVNVMYGGTVIADFPYIDPAGIVYDAVTKDPIENAVVNIYQDNNTNGIFDAGDILAFSQVTALDGAYAWPLAGVASYVIEVTPPDASYSFVSAAIPPTVAPDPLPGPAVNDPDGINSGVYYLAFRFIAGSGDLIGNDIPLDPPATGSIMLTKKASKNRVTTGDMVSYTVMAENTQLAALNSISIHDLIPAGFTYVDSSAKLVRAGVDGLLNTSDDVKALLDVTGNRPLVFEPIDFAGNEIVKISYLLRVGSGVTQGEYINRATPYSGNNIAGSTATESVLVVADPIFEKTTIIGKVFHDRDGDGWQDASDVKALYIQSDMIESGSMTVDYGDGPITVDDQNISSEGGVFLGSLSGRSSVSDLPEDHRMIIYARTNETDHSDILITTKEGTRLVIEKDGHISTEHTGDKARGLTGQDIQVQVEYVSSHTANYNVVITLTNYGVQEEGIPGVRLATPAGLLIETDSYGRFHIADVEGGRLERGRNFIMKVDPATLPKASQFTTENPRVMRITQGIMNKINFGIKLPAQVMPEKEVTVNSGEVLLETGKSTHSGKWVTKKRKIDEIKTVKLKNIIEPIRFESGKSNINDTFMESLSNIIDSLVEKENVRLHIVGHTDNQPLARRRANKLYNNNYELSRARAERVGKVLQEAIRLPDKALSYESKGPDEPIADNGTPEGMAQNRRVEIEIWYDETLEKLVEEKVFEEEIEQIKQPASVKTTSRVMLPDGGVIWATQDPAVIDPRLDVTVTNKAETSDGSFIHPVHFSIYSNYRTFIDHWELLITRANDTDFVKPVKVLRGSEISIAHRIEWSGETDSEIKLHAGEELLYVLRAYDSEGRLDETKPGRLSLVHGYKDTSSVIHESSVDSNAEGVEIYGESSLMRQSIPIAGSRVRIHGSDIPEGYRLQINGEPVSVDSKGTFAIENIETSGQHTFKVDVIDSKGEAWQRDLDIDISDTYFFMVGIADITVGQNNISGSIEPLSVDDHFDEDVFVDGRLAFYLKGKIKGTYLITAQMDTHEDELSDIFSDIHKKDPRSVFRRLDPDRFYPVYGDDSTTIDDTDSQGKFYVRVDWDKSQVLWGNYHTGLAGTEYGQYNRSLYGARYRHNNQATTRYGEHRTELTAFASEAQTVFAHNELSATGGSLYYLKNTDIVQGSDKIWIEIRGKDTERVVENIPMQRGRDYEIDEIQGRIILSRPLTQIADQTGPSIIKDKPLDGNTVFLMADYEYVPDGFDADKSTYGARGKGWINDHVAVGGTYVQENRDNTDYELKGFDVTLKAGQGTYLKGEYATSDARQSGNAFTSHDGGLSFFEKNSATPSADISGEAVSLEARINLSEMSHNEYDGTIAAWWKERDGGFSISRLTDGNKTTEYGIEGEGKITDSLSLSVRGTVLEQDTVNTEKAMSVQADYRAGDKWTVSSEVRHVIEEPAADDKIRGTLGALRLAYDITPDINVYGIGQFTLENNDHYEDNNLGTLGFRALLKHEFSVRAEASAGDRGNSVRIGADYAASDTRTMYGTYTLSTDRTDGSNGVFTVGQRSSVSNQLNVYTEHQFNHGDVQAGIAQVYGLDYALTKWTTVGLSVQSSDTDGLTGGTDRDVGTLSLNYTHGRTRANAKLEYRHDSGQENIYQWLTTNSINYQAFENVTLLGKISFSDTDDRHGPDGDAKFIEADLGFAYRPVSHDRLNMLGKYTYLYDLPSAGQDDGSNIDERSHIISLEGIYDLGHRWEAGAKYAYKLGEIREERNAGDWFDTQVDYAAIIGRYHLLEKWDGLLKYQWLRVKESDDQRQGSLVGIYRHINEYFKLGAGYNFTDFDDDLTNLDYQSHGWFFNVVGKY